MQRHETPRLTGSSLYFYLSSPLAPISLFCQIAIHIHAHICPINPHYASSPSNATSPITTILYFLLPCPLPPADGSTSTLTVILHTRYFHLDITSVLAKAALAVDMTAAQPAGQGPQGRPAVVRCEGVRHVHASWINGETKQDGTTADMIFRIPRLIEHVSSIMSLEEGDVILTGTPSGVGPIQPGDKIECALSQPNGEELLKLDFEAIQREGGYSFKED
ncbi:hypothetical protein NLJ89_g2506 [Agrocybe chaxingu]|uniref:Fumarylacetoacetase-like C-terminal domain-containing protein n=1 Tax=Agrocybe chaxingu TaxID=84603 RepID=A0A9W8K5S5_9AGAR|nr:hypothetical protein NLJ89_g2506 [Agrocybe chaxingu]